MAATGEYTAFYGGTVSGALAGIVATVNRVTAIYERDLSISFTLVANNDLIIYTNAVDRPVHERHELGRPERRTRRT